MYATRDGQTAIAKLFISKGADLNVQNDVSSIIYLFYSFVALLIGVRVVLLSEWKNCSHDGYEWRPSSNSRTTYKKWSRCKCDR